MPKEYSDNRLFLKITFILIMTLSYFSEVNFDELKEMKYVQNDKLESFTPSPENFSVIQTSFRGKFHYNFVLTNPEVIFIVQKSPENFDQEKLENGDLSLMIGPGFEYSLGFAESEEDLDLNFLNLYNQFKSEGILQESRFNLEMAPHQLEAWKPSLLINALANHFEILDLIKNVDYRGKPDYFGDIDVKIKDRYDIKVFFSNVVGYKAEQILKEYAADVIQTKRNLLYEQKGCLDKIGHNNYSEVEEKMTNYFRDLSRKGFSNDILEPYYDFYNLSFSQLVNLEAIKLFFESSYIERKNPKNLYLKSLMENLPPVIPDNYRINFGELAFHYENQFELGSYLKDEFLNEFENIIKPIARENFKSIIEENTSQETGRLSVHDAIKKKFSSDLDSLNAEVLQKFYSVEFDEEEKNTFTDKIIEKVDLIDFFWDCQNYEIKCKVENFLKSYISNTLENSLFGDLMSYGFEKQKKFRRNYNVFLKKRLANMVLPMVGAKIDESIVDRSYVILKED